MSEAALSKTYLTAFVDLLGFSAALLRLQGTEQDLEIMERISKAVTSFRRTFRNFYGVQAERFAAEAPETLNGRALELWNARRPPDPTIQTFTDTVIISIPVNTSDPLTTAMALHALIGACAVTSFVLLAVHGAAVRGGISIGLGTPIEGNEIVSAGLVKAHWLESKKAVNPRIILGAELTDLMNNLRSLEGRPADVASLVTKILNTTDRYLETEADGYRFVDYLGRDVVTKAPGRQDQVLALLLQQVRLRRDEISGDNEETVRARAKWEWLEAYAMRKQGTITTGETR